jgi:hypothetical protein
LRAAKSGESIVPGFRRGAPQSGLLLVTEIPSIVIAQYDFIDSANSILQEREPDALEHIPGGERQICKRISAKIPLRWFQRRGIREVGRIDRQDANAVRPQSMTKTLGKERLCRFRRAEGLVDRSHIPPQSRRAIYEYNIRGGGLVDQRQEMFGKKHRHHGSFARAERRRRARNQYLNEPCTKAP